MKRWLLTIVAALTLSVGFACYCPCSSGMQCMCAQEYCPPEGCGDPMCTCDNCHGGIYPPIPPIPAESYLGFNGGCAVEPSIGWLDMSYPPDDFFNYVWLDESWFTGDATWFNLSSAPECFDMAVTPGKGWQFLNYPMVSAQGWSAWSEGETNEYGGMVFHVMKDTTPYMPYYDPAQSYNYICISMDRVYEVTFDPGDHGRLPEDFVNPQCILPGATVEIPEPIVDEGWEFVCWDGGDPTDIQYDAYFTAQYVRVGAHTVTFNEGEHGTLQDSTKRIQSVFDHGAADDPGIRPSSGWRFAGWDKSFNDVISDLTVNAIYERIHCTCVFDPGAYGDLAKASLRTQVVEWGAAPTSPGVTIKPEYAADWRFKRWSPAVGQVTTNTTYTAVYGPPVYYRVNVEGYPLETVESGTAREYHAPPAINNDSTNQTYLGYIGTGSFPSRGWSDSVSVRIYENSALQWLYRTQYLMLSSSNDYDLGMIYNADTGLPLESETWFAADQTVRLRGQSAENARCVKFIVNGEEFEGEEVEIWMNEAKVIEAVFEKNFYTVTFDPGMYGELTDPSLSPQEVEPGQSATCPDVLVKPEYANDWRFAGWDNVPSDVHSDITVYAIYEPQPKYSVKVDGVEQGPVTAGTTLSFSAPEDEYETDTRRICTGYVGSGSFPPGGTESYVSATICEDSTLDWIMEWHCRIVGSVNDPSLGRLCNDMGMDLTEEWVPEHSTFTVHAYPNGADVRVVRIRVNEDVYQGDTASFTVSGPTTVTAEFERIVCTVTFDPGEHGELADPNLGTQTVSPGQDAQDPGCTVLPGHNYRFIGWEPNYCNIQSDTICRAVYEHGPSTVTFDPGQYGDLSDPSLAEQTVDFGQDAADPGITMKPDCEHDWKFIRWEPDCHGITADTTCRAVYEQRIWHAVLVDGEERGPIEDDTLFETDAPVPEASEGTQIFCTGWLGTGSFPEHGTRTRASAKIKADSTLDWLFATNYCLTASYNGLGEIAHVATGNSLAASTWLPAGTNLSLVATAKEGVVCTSFTLNGEAVDGTNVTFTLTGPATVTAAFAWKTYTVTFDPGDHGALADERSAEQTVQHGNNAIDPGVTVKAEDARGWKFIGWEPSHRNITSNTTCRAVYAERIWRTVVIDGVASFVEDGAAFVTNAPVPEASEGTQIVCTGWIGTGSFPERGTADTVLTTINADSSLDWLYATNHLVKVGHSRHGDVIDTVTGVSVGTNWMPSGTNLTLKAVPVEDASFDGWTSEGLDPAPEAAEASFALNGPVTLYAAFHPNHVTVTFDAAPHGTIADSALASQTIDYGGDAVEPQVTPESGWKLARWDKPFTNVLDNTTVKASYECLYVIKVNDEVVTPGNIVDETFFAPGTGTANGRQIVCTGWRGTGSFPESGTTNFVTVTVTNDSSIVWLYATNYLFEASVEGPGSICDAATGLPMGGCYLPAGTNFVVEAVPDQDAYFSLWDADGMVTNDGPYLVCFLEAPIRAHATFGRDCEVTVGIDDSSLKDVTEDDDISLVGLVTGGTAQAYRWRAARMKDDGTYDIATDIGQTCSSTIQLAEGTWRLEFCALDANGTWSRPVVAEIEVKPGKQLPDLQLYGDNVAFLDANGLEITHAKTGDCVTVAIELKNGPRAAMEGPIDVCLYDGWLSEADLATFTSLDPRVLAHTSIAGLDAGATSLIELPWIVGCDQAENDLGYANGPRPLSLVAVSRNGATELLTNNNITGRMFAIGTEDDMDLLRIAISGPATTTTAGFYALKVKCWYNYKGEEIPAVGCSVKIRVDGLSLPTLFTPAPGGQFTLCYQYPTEGEVPVTAEASDGSLTATASLTYTAVREPVYKPNLTVRDMKLTGSGVYRECPSPAIVHRNGQVDASARIVNNGRTATTKPFTVACQVRQDAERDWTTVATAYIESGFAPGAETNLTFALPNTVTGVKKTWHVRIYADSNFDIDEIDDSKDDNSEEGTMTVRSGADLSVSLFGVSPYEFIVGEQVTASCKIWNHGLVDSTEPFMVNILVDGWRFAQYRLEATIPAEGSITADIPFDSTDFPPGDRWVSLYVDGDREIDELVEENNLSNEHLVIAHAAEPDLCVLSQNITWSPDDVPLAGHDYTFQARIWNAKFAIAATNVTVEFFLETEGTRLSLGSATLKELPRDTSAVVKAPNAYTAERGFHVVRVKVRSESGHDQIAVNNEATTSFNVEIPVAKVACADFRNLVAGESVTLDGSASERCASFEWKIVDSPEGSAPILANSTSSVATFIPDLVGLYRLQFCVGDDAFTSEPKEIIVHVSKVFVEAVSVNGTISPTERVVYASGDRPCYTFTPWVYYEFDDAKLDNVTLTNVVNGAHACSYTFEPLQRSHRLAMSGRCVYNGRIVSDGEGGYTLYINPALETVEIDSLPGDVTVAVKPNVKTVRLPENARLKIVKDEKYDISRFIDCKGLTQNGATVWNVADASLKDTEDHEIAKSLEQLGTLFDPSADSPVTFSTTIEGLTYTLHESTTLEGLNSESETRYTTVGDGKEWSPVTAKEPSSSKFYTISVSK